VSIGSWEPGNKTSLQVVEHGKLIELLTCFRQADPAMLADSMSPDQIQRDAKLMKLGEDSWRNCESLADDEFEPLVRFFTLAEMQLPGWDGGVRSPVIYLVNHMKQRGLFTPELRKWIKKNTDNRYLPNGSVL